MSSNSAASLPRAGVDLGRTRWSMVAAVREGSEEQARRSLSELCQRYWVPVYTYIRRSGHSPEESVSLVQAFLSRLVTRLRAGQDGIKTGFRVFLQSQLEEFLASPSSRQSAEESAATMQPPWPLEQIEARQSREHKAGMSASEALQRAFALEMLAIALDRLRKEAEHSERSALFEAVRPYLSREPGPEDYAALAENMQSSPLAAVIAVKRLRQRFQELIDDEIAQTVGDGAVDKERQTLFTLVMPGTAE